MATAPPILVWTPGGGTPVGGVSSGGPVYSQAGTTQLIEGQAYVDVVFGSVQTNDEWVLVECIVVNEIDVDPLNIWPGIITDKTTAGFRLQLNGMPDSGNYYLHWAVSGVNITPTLATSYTLTGPSSGGLSVASTFTVALPPSTTFGAVVTITPDDGGGGGAFSPTSVTLSSGSASATFTYTPSSYGAKTISVTNSGTLTNPASIAFTALASTYTLSGPSSGGVGVASTNFTVALPVGGAVAGTVTITPHDGGGGGTFTPTTVGLTTGAPSATFTYTPASTGAKTISVTNNGGLTNPGNLTYTASFDPSTITGLKLWLKADAIAGPPTDGTLLSAWNDSSANGYNLTNAGGGERPTFKTNIVNSLPVVRFNGTTNKMVGGGNIVSAQPNTFIAVVKNVAGTDCHFYRGDPSNQLAAVGGADGFFYLYGGATAINDGINHNGAFHVYTGIFASGNATGYVDGTLTLPSSASGSAAPNVLALFWSGIQFWPGDVAEFLFYNTALGSTDRANVEAYLKAKYNTP